METESQHCYVFVFMLEMAVLVQVAPGGLLVGIRKDVVVEVGEHL